MFAAYSFGKNSSKIVALDIGMSYGDSMNY
jgi:hypothetical protein